MINFEFLNKLHGNLASRNLDGDLTKDEQTSLSFVRMFLVRRLNLIVLEFSPHIMDAIYLIFCSPLLEWGTYFPFFWKEALNLKARPPQIAQTALRLSSGRWTPSTTATPARCTTPRDGWKAKLRKSTV